MKNTLEYKILKHLSKNLSGKPIDISEIESNKELLESVILDLKNRKLIETEPYPTETSDIDGFMIISASEKPDKCKINLLGREYLDNLDKYEVELNLAKSNIEANELNRRVAKRNKNETIINIILGIINIGILIYQVITAE